MNIGFTTLFSFRPHVEHMYYLLKQFELAGDNVFQFNCSGKISNCYNLELKQGNKFIECTKCRVGSLYSYSQKNCYFIDPKLHENLDQNSKDELVQSSSYSLTRIETLSPENKERVFNIQEQLHRPVEVVFANAKYWIKKNNLDFIFLFNGRMDITRAVMRACKETQTKFCCIERTLFAHGLQLNFGENALSLKEIHELEKKYRDKPLKRKQALIAANYLCSRFKKEENLEWRNYNKDAKNIKWPTKGDGLKILILPSSKNEVAGEHDWRNDWDDYQVLFEKIINKLGASFDNCVLRSHPNWGQKIGNSKGHFILKYYKNWCQNKGIHFIPPESKASTSELMKQADLVLLNGSSAVYEASLLGTPVICIARCRYQNANIAKVILSQKELDEFNVNEFMNRPHEDVLRSLLRFFYTYSVRYAIFSKEIRAESIFDFWYAKTIDIKRLKHMMTSYTLIPDDTDFAENSDEEDEIIKYLQKRQWNLITAPKEDSIKRNKIKRRGAYVIVDKIRNKLKRGDL